MTHSPFRRLRAALAAAALTGAVADLMAPAALAATPPPTRATSPAPATSPGAATPPRGSVATIVATFRRTPTFARQMRLSCNVCHLGGFPQLTRFGRLFKLNGYTLSNLPQIPDDADTTVRRAMALSPIPGLSAMVVISSTTLARGVGGATGTRTEYPQELGLFFGGEVAPNLGALLQVSYFDAAGQVAINNSDVRYATHRLLAGRDLLLGATLHNNPTVQDAWNTLPAWNYPFATSPLAPRPAATTVLDGRLAQAVLGAGAYALWDNVLYAELTGYVPARQGPRSLTEPMDTSTVHGIAPYWRLALQNRSGPVTVMVGTFGASVELERPGAQGTHDQYQDIGLDAQLERPAGRGSVVARGSVTWERQQLAALHIVAASPAAAGTPTSLRVVRVNATYAPTATWAFSTGMFSTSGSRDAAVYAAGPVTGSRSGTPDTDAAVAEVTAAPWTNARVGVQYTAYGRFNGSSASYDVASGGRSASDNNSLYVYLWFAF